MLLDRPLVVGGQLWGTIFTFEKAGDVFPDHVHTEENNHITLLAFGAIRCTGHPKHEGKVLEARAGGTVVNWVAGEPHGFVALTDGTTIINIRKVRGDG
jgi:hypothetical protein